MISTVYISSKYYANLAIFNNKTKIKIKSFKKSSQHNNYLYFYLHNLSNVSPTTLLINRNEYCKFTTS